MTTLEEQYGRDLTPSELFIEVGDALSGRVAQVAEQLDKLLDRATLHASLEAAVLALGTVQAVLTQLQATTLAVEVMSVPNPQPTAPDTSVIWPTGSPRLRIYRPDDEDEL